MAKVNISLPDALLEDVDSRANRAGLSRSGFIQEAASNYITSLERDSKATARAEKISQAIEQMREISRDMPPGVDGTEIIGRFRTQPEPWRTDEVSEK